MKELLDTLDKILSMVNGDLKTNTLLDNPNNNDLNDAYNEGVKAMAAQVSFYISTILGLKTLFKEAEDQGHTLTIEIVGEQ